MRGVGGWIKGDSTTREEDQQREGYACPCGQTSLRNDTGRGQNRRKHTRSVVAADNDAVHAAHRDFTPAARPPHWVPAVAHGLVVGLAHTPAGAVLRGARCDTGHRTSTGSGETTGAHTTFHGQGATGPLPRAYLHAALLARGALVDGVVPAGAVVVLRHEAVGVAVGSCRLTQPIAAKQATVVEPKGQ
jgi:hypothetical protein